MENTITESQSRNAAKVAGFASAIALVGVAAVKAKRAVAQRRADRRARREAPLTQEA